MGAVPENKMKIATAVLCSGRKLVANGSYQATKIWLKEGFVLAVFPKCTK